MYALVVFESMFGNTEQLAGAVADGLRVNFDVDVINVDDAPRTVPDDVDLLVVGAPTHAFGLSRKRVRADVETRIGSETVSKSANLRDWLSVGPRIRDLYAAAFGTRPSRASWAHGSAARRVAKLLQRRGYRMIERPEDFYVDDIQGPLAEGEAERARRWGADVAMRWDRLASDLID